jgi:DNA-binding NarL/FixJ family response regulator
VNGPTQRVPANALGISEGTVKVHVNAAYRALGVHNRVSATTALLARSILAASAYELALTGKNLPL